MVRPYKAVAEAINWKEEGSTIQATQEQIRQYLRLWPCVCAKCSVCEFILSEMRNWEESNE